MAENKINEVAKLLGVELEEEFKLKEKDTNYIIHTKYKLTQNGLMGWSVSEQKWWYSTMLQHLLTGQYEIIKLPKPILDKKEKEYLSAVIKPFRKYVKYIYKYDYKVNERITICYSEYVGNVRMGFSLPSFEKGTMYKGMKTNKQYTLEELGL